MDYPHSSPGLAEPVLAAHASLIDAIRSAADAVCGGRADPRYSAALDGVEADLFDLDDMVAELDVGPPGLLREPWLATSELAHSYLWEVAEHAVPIPRLHLDDVDLTDVLEVASAGESIKMLELAEELLGVEPIDRHVLVGLATRNLAERDDIGPFVRSIWVFTIGLASFLRDVLREDQNLAESAQAVVATVVFEFCEFLEYLNPRFVLPASDVELRHPAQPTDPHAFADEAVLPLPPGFSQGEPASAFSRIGTEGHAWELRGDDPPLPHKPRRPSGSPSSSSSSSSSPSSSSSSSSGSSSSSSERRVPDRPGSSSAAPAPDKPPEPVEATALCEKPAKERKGRAYAGVPALTLPYSGAVECSAIIGVKQVVLPCEPVSSFPAASFAFVGLSSTRSKRHVQAGYGRVRKAGKGNLFTAPYVEQFSGPRRVDKFRKFLVGDLANENSVLTRCIWNKEGEYWWFKVGDAYERAPKLPVWKSEHLYVLNASAEIVDLGSQMVGTKTHPCLWSDVKWKFIGDKKYRTGIPKDSVKTSNPKIGQAQWTSDSSFKVWDVRY